MDEQWVRSTHALGNQISIDPLSQYSNEKPKSHQLDGRALVDMMHKDPFINEKIFKNFSKDGMKLDTNTEKDKLLVKRLMYYFGPYTLKENGESLY